MIVLPNTPPLPVPVALLSDSPVSAHISLKRLSIPENPQNHSDCVKYTVYLEEYLDDVFQVLVDESGSMNLEDLADLAATTVIYRGQTPWKNVVCTPKKKPMKLARPKSEWTLAMDVGISLVSVALMYTKLGASLINELIEMESRESDSKWRSVTDYYKKALGILGFTSKFLAASGDQSQINPFLIPVLEKVCHIGVQLSILCKSSWMNRTSFEVHESFSSSNNGVLCRVAIWIMNEISLCQNLFRKLDSQSGDGSICLNCDGWVEYSEVFIRYVTAYSGLFLSIEYYQKGELGPAIGLVHFALLSLQVKSLSQTADEQKNYKKLKDKLVGKKNHNFIANLHSLTTLKIDKSVFRDSAGVVLNDLTYLFNQLVYLRLKYTKENDNLRFEPVSDWKDVKSDTRWPTGTKIPTSGFEEYLPKTLVQEKSGFNPHFKGQYF